MGRLPARAARSAGSGPASTSSFNDYQKVRWGWVGFFDSFDDPAVAGALFDTACAWAAGTGRRDLRRAGLLHDQRRARPAGRRLRHPPDPADPAEPPLLRIAVGRARLGAGHGPVGLALRPRPRPALSERQRRTLDRIQQRAQVTVRGIRMDDFDAEVGRFFEVYNAAWSHNWGFAPMPEAEIRHLAGQLKQIINPNWAFGLETPDGQVVGVCLALPDVNRLDAAGALGPAAPVRVVPAADRPQEAAPRPGLGPRRPTRTTSTWPSAPCCTGRSSTAWPPIGIRTAEASWTLATNHRINNQLAAMGAHRSKVWRLYQRPAARG